MAYTKPVRLLQIWLAWSLAFFFCIAAPAQAMSASKALANPLATKLDTHYFPINNTDPMGLAPLSDLRAIISQDSVGKQYLGAFDKLAASGWQVKFGALTGIEGETRPDERAIYIKSGEHSIMQAGTFFHEILHALISEDSSLIPQGIYKADGGSRHAWVIGMERQMIDRLNQKGTFDAAKSALSPIRVPDLKVGQYLDNSAKFRGLNLNSNKVRQQIYDMIIDPKGSFQMNKKYVDEA
jgi:hypothetical protein